MIKIRSLSSEKELQWCIEFYSEKVPYSLINKEFAINNLRAACKNPSYILKIITINDIKIGWFLAQIGRPSEHSNSKALNQIYYYANTTGYTSVRCVKESFKYLEQEALNRKINILTATNSPYDDRLQLVRILEKQGWNRYSYYAIKDLSKSIQNYQGTFKEVP